MQEFPVKTEHEGSADQALSRYLENTEEIRRLSVPQIRSIDGADSYRETLLRNYVRIGDLAKENEQILSAYFYPRLRSGRDLSADELRTMLRFSHALNNAYMISNLDTPLADQQSLRLLCEAEKTGNEDLRVIALDEIVSAAYVMMSITERFFPVSEICLEYQKAGFEAAEKLLEYLEPDKFSALSEASRELVAINARYIRVVSEIEGIPQNAENNARLLKRMKAALALGDDPFYRDRLPNYSWNIHELRTLEYICSLTDFNNENGFCGEDLRFINDCTKRLRELCFSEEPIYAVAHDTETVELYSCRNAYLVGDSSLAEYKERLRVLALQDGRRDLSEDLPLVMLHAPLEYLLLLDPDDLSEEDQEFLCTFYGRLVSYMHQTPKMGRMTSLLSYLSLILKNYVDVPGKTDYQTLGLDLIAALHPPTYVHTLCVADFTACLTRHLLKRRPEEFVGMPGIDSAEDAVGKAGEIEAFARNAALCHDFGKLAIMETIITYGRDLLHEEFRFIKVHPSIGAHLLSLSPETRDYADIACGHHKWYDDSRGYPEAFCLSESPYRAIISIVACADCLDAATDSVGRSYKTGKKLAELIGEFEEGSGSRYAPCIVELFSEEEVRAEVEEILKNRRDRNYIKTYHVLEEYDVR